MRFLFIVGLALPFFALAATFEPPACRFPLEAPGVWQGEHDETKSNQTEDVFLLGGGIGGALVYRHVPKDGRPSFVEKIYSSLAEARRDYHHMLLLEKALSANVNVGNRIRTAKVLKLDGRSLFLEDIRGTDVEKLYNETPDRRDVLWDKLWAGLNVISGSLVDFSRQREQFDRWQLEPDGEVPVPDDMRKWKEEPRPGKPDRKLPELNVHYEERHPCNRRWIRRSILIHGQNVILEPDGMMVVVDPG